MPKKKENYSCFGDPPKTLDEHPFYGYQLDAEQKEFANAIWNPDNDIIFCDAKAGSGKTTVATGVANLLVRYGFFDKLVYIMSPCADNKQGWLPGTITEKSAVYFEAFYQALVNCGCNLQTDLNDESMANQKNGTAFITTITDTYLRGSNIENAVVIIDEAQNFTVEQLRKTLTRVCPTTKTIVIGHTLQCDLPRARMSGFAKYIEHFKDHDRCQVCKLTTNHRGWVSQWADEFIDENEYPKKEATANE